MSVAQFNEYLHQRLELGEKYFLLPISKCEFLIHKVRNCRMCRLKKSRTNIVFGEGRLDSSVMLVGEAPGYQEDLKGRPFVGEAGKLLNEILEAIEINRADIYITNIIKCRPPENRDPRPDEVNTCAPFLKQQIEIIQPRVVVTLGRYAAQYLLNTNAPINSIRGQTFDLPRFKLIPTFHPAYVLRNPGMKKFLYEDLKKSLKVIPAESCSRSV